MDDQQDLFVDPRVPEGFRYEPDVIDESEESRLLDQIRELPFAAFQFHGYEGRRRVVSYGWRYDFERRAVERSSEMPPFLVALRETAARFADRPADTFQQALVTEYAPGAPIGWHKDKPMFDDVVGISLLSACVFRLRRRAGTRWERYSFTAAPRSAYLLRGPARTEWEHSIPPVETLRYSVTFRNFRSDAIPNQSPAP
jgi:alkylated DNA repair dioxygenase AlkB